jgi:hypothetical protein
MNIAEYYDRVFRLWGALALQIDAMARTATRFKVCLDRMQISWLADKPSGRGLAVVQISPMST